MVTLSHWLTPSGTVSPPPYLSPSPPPRFESFLLPGTGTSTPLCYSFPFPRSSPSRVCTPVGTEGTDPVCVPVNDSVSSHPPLDPNPFISRLRRCIQSVTGICEWTSRPKIFPFSPRTRVGSDSLRLTGPPPYR